MSSIVDFQDLMDDANELSSRIGTDTYPGVNRTLNQLLEKNQEKFNKKSAYFSTDANEISASILLAGRGIDTPKLTQVIENLKAPVSAPVSQESFDTYDKLYDLEQLKEVDLKSFLKSEKEIALMSVIEETKNQTLRDIEDSFQINDDLEWEQQKQKIMQEFLGSFNPDLAISNTTTTTINPRSASMSTSMQGRTVMSDIEMEFSKEVYLYNEKLINMEQPKPDLLANFTNLSQRLNDKNIEELWSMIYFMCNMPTFKNDYDKTTLDQTELSQITPTTMERDNSIQAQIYYVNQAVTYLECCFKELLQNTVNANLKQARIGGAPGTLALVTGYLRLSQSEKYHQNFEEIFDEHQPLWPTVFLCIRCGDIDAARTVALKTKKDDLVGFFDELLRSNTGIRRLGTSSENKLKLEYKSKIKRSNDLYKRAVYSYLCRLGEDDYISKLLDNVDDFLWFKLNTIVFDATTTVAASTDRNTTEIASANVTFVEFQTKLSVEFGEKHFVKQRNPFIYLQVLLLTAQFEMAIEFMLKYETMVVHGVHMALALYERRMLNLTSIKNFACSTQLFTNGEPTESKCMRRLNLACLIKMYTRKFECTDPREALQYYFFLRNMPVALPSKKRIISYFTQYVTELALETREFELFFGKLEKNAIRRPGVLDKFISEMNTQSIICLVAEEMENKGLIEDSVKLFDLCKEYQRVLELCNKLISQVVTEINTPNSTRDRLKTLAFSIALRYKTETVTSLKAIQKSTISTFYLLIDLMTFFDFYHAENWESAYETINKLGILPKSSFNVETSVKEFISYSEDIKRNFPDIILAGMTILSNLFANLNRNSLSNSFKSLESSMLNEKNQILMQLKEQAKALIKFVGCIPYRLSGDINARLLQLEVTMN